jgi:NAD(P)-dependent dehydrogenase (short-subunit alcohol dehydrogenase family)
VSDFDGLVAVVTGGASGIGLATAHLLSERGARVACLDLSPDGVPEPLVGVRCDVADDPSVRAAVDTVVERWGRLDVVVNNAGIGAVGGVGDTDDDTWLRLLDVNVVGMARMVRAALPHLRASPAAAVVTTASIAGTAGHRPTRGLLGEQGRRRRADAGHGRRPRARGDPGQRGRSWHGGDAVGRAAARGR